MEKDELLKFQKRCKKEAETAYSFAKYECNKHAKIVMQDKILPITIEHLR